MKQITFLASFLVIASGFSFLSGGRPQHGPLLIIDTGGCNFGNIPNIGAHEQTFTLFNKGDESLRITAVNPACGCTIASLKDSLVAPGGSTSLLIRFQENEHWPGGFQKQVSIVSNSRDSAKKKFWFYGRFAGAPGWDSVRTRTFIYPNLKPRSFPLPSVKN